MNPDYPRLGRREERDADLQRRKDEQDADTRDVDELGDESGMSLSRLYSKEDTAWAKRPILQADIVLVPGLGRELHHAATWKADDLTVWPRDLLPSDLPDIRVLSFNYTTTLTGTTSEAGIRDHAKDLVILLSNEREEDELARLRPIVFVGHSLGGIIIKRALLTAHQDLTRYGSLWEASRGVMFFATPHYGMDNSAWQRFIHHALKFDAPVEGAKPTGGMIAEIKENSVALEKISKDFEHLQDGLVFYSFVEDDRTEGLGGVLVEERDGRMRASTEKYMRISGNHVDLCKFRRAHHEKDAFLPVSEGIKWLLEGTPKAIDRIPFEAKRALYSLSRDEFHSWFLDRKPTEGTCGWITDKLEFRDWFANKPGKQWLWISGPPACGKSYLARHIVVDIGWLESQGALIHCFLSSALPGRGNVLALLRATLHQALRLAPELVEDNLLPKFEERQAAMMKEVQDQELWTEDALTSVWPDIMAKVTENHPLAAVVDGFDEMKQECQEGFMECLERFHRKASTPQNLRLLLLSREHHKTGLNLGPGKLDFVKCELTTEDTSNDVDKSFEAGLRYVWGTGTKRDIDVVIRDRISVLVREKSVGMHLWVTLLLEDLRRSRAVRSEGQMLKRLESMPPGIGGLYDSILGRMEQRINAPFIKQVLLWAAFQKEGLKPDEFNIAQALGRMVEDYPAGDSEQITHQMLEEYLDDNVEITVNLHCGHLARFCEGRLEPVHKGLKEHLMTVRNDGSFSELCMEKGRASAAVAHVCTTYLTMSYFEDSGDKRDPARTDLWESKVRKRIKEHKFVRYASLYWHKHLKDATGSGKQSRPPPDAIGAALDAHQTLLQNGATSYSRSWSEVWWFLSRQPNHVYPSECPAKLISTPKQVEVVKKKTVAGTPTSNRRAQLSTAPTQENAHAERRPRTTTTALAEEKPHISLDELPAPAPPHGQPGRENAGSAVPPADQVSKPKKAGWLTRVVNTTKLLAKEIIDF
ncbi:hypothetical protein B0T22DRAFT_461780 [Podospora appendiculata]|uniref:DUF676 domain-containing protein n=1 Tax=Podospora appendiculata TaxID=314037 RepID=A0AAE0XBS4_9PEZI|nr:hypothetical protein B0T22DRAFT_461780 [Podospora appendiculata]